jgi:hypothetical protein
VIVVVVVGTIKVVTKYADVASSHDRYLEFLPVRTKSPLYLTEASSILNGSCGFLREPHPNTKAGPLESNNARTLHSLQLRWRLCVKHVMNLKFHDLSN